MDSKSWVYYEFTWFFMMRCCPILFFAFTASSHCCGQNFLHLKGQSFLYFKKNNHRETVYGVGDVITFDLKGDKTKVSGQIKGFEDSLVVFQSFKLNPKEIAALYVDNKTKIWFILRYKYEKIFFLTGAAFLPLDVVNTGKIEGEAVLVSGGLIGAGLLAKGLISHKISIKGTRKLVVIGY